MTAVVVLDCSAKCLEIATTTDVFPRINHPVVCSFDIFWLNASIPVGQWHLFMQAEDRLLSLRDLQARKTSGQDQEFTSINNLISRFRTSRWGHPRNIMPQA